MESTTIYYLEMLRRDALRRMPTPQGLHVWLIDPPRPEMNRKFYRDIGAAWQWTDRLDWPDDDWARYARRPEIQTWVGEYEGESIGYFELESQEAGSVEIVYFGLLPEFVGRGLGGPFLARAVELAWDVPTVRRVWVHTCTDDHPRAMDNYLRQGFVLYKTETD